MRWSLHPMFFDFAVISIAHGKPADGSTYALLVWIDVERYRHDDDRKFEELIDIGGEG